MKEYISNKLSISAYMHCSKCLEELPSDMSPQQYAAFDIGWTRQGLQVWCYRHKANIIHVDFEGMKHPANLTCEEVDDD